MKYNIKFWQMQKYLPTKRHKNLRQRYVEDSMDVEVKELSEAEFPVAFIIHDYHSVYENAKTYDDFKKEKGDYRMFSEEIRTHEGLLFKPVRITAGAAISTCFEPLEHIKWKLRMEKPYSCGGEDFTEDSIVKYNDRDGCVALIESRAAYYRIFNGIIWEQCGEPIYEIATFGLGHNHGGTGFFIHFIRDDRFLSKNCFNALQREEAIEYGKNTAAGRGDTKDVDCIGKHDNIEVVMPEMVTKKRPEPKKEMSVHVDIEIHDGTPIEKIERIIEEALNDHGIDCTYIVETENS